MKNIKRTILIWWLSLLPIEYSIPRKYRKILRELNIIKLFISNIYEEINAPKTEKINALYLYLFGLRKHKTFEDYISHAFVWEHTGEKQGTIFWYNISKWDLTTSTAMYEQKREYSSMYAIIGSLIAIAIIIGIIYLINILQ